MIETEFVTLMHCGQYIDASLLEKGIYASSKPYIYEKGTTIKSLIDKAILMKDMIGNPFISKEYINNLSMCELSKISITLKPE